MPGLHIDKVGESGIYKNSVQDLNELNNLPIDKLKNNERRLVVAEKSDYYFDSESGTWIKFIEENNHYKSPVQTLEDLNNLPVDQLKNNERRFVISENYDYFFDQEAGSWRKETEKELTPSEKFSFLNGFNPDDMKFVFFQNSQYDGDVLEYLEVTDKIRNEKIRVIDGNVPMYTLFFVRNQVFENYRIDFSAGYTHFENIGWEGVDYCVRSASYIDWVGRPSWDRLNFSDWFSLHGDKDIRIINVEDIWIGKIPKRPNLLEFWRGTKAEYEQLPVKNHDTTHYLFTDVSNSEVVRLKDQVLSVALWVLNEGTGLWEFNYNHNSINESTEVEFIPASSSIQAVIAAEVQPYTLVVNGIATVFANSKPDEDILVTVLIQTVADV